MTTKKAFIAFMGLCLLGTNLLFPFSAESAEKKNENPWRKIVQEENTRERDIGGFEFHLFPILKTIFGTSSSTSTESIQQPEPQKVEERKETPRDSKSTTTPTTTTPTTTPRQGTTTPPLSSTTTPATPPKDTGSVIQSVIRILNFIDPTATTTGNEYKQGKLSDNTTRILHAISLILLLFGALAAFRAWRREIVYLLVGGGILLALGVGYINSAVRDIPIEFSPTVTLDNLWANYKIHFLEEGTGRTMDPSRDSITTSEGQAYTMLRAVWEDDKETFDRSWKWTKDNLRRKDDPGISWLFGKGQKGYGVITESGGINSASDADTDIALALIFAYARWNEPLYQGDAYVLLDQIWKNDVVMVRGKPYLAASDSEKKSTGPIAMNVSYFFPAAYRVFAEFDDKHSWNALVDTSYDVLTRSSEQTFGYAKSAGLPPDWLVMDRTTGALRAGTDPQMTTNYGFDAFRVPWRIALDAIWWDEPRAKKYLEKLSFLKDEWRARGSIYPVYDHAGSPVLPIESPAAYGANLGYFIIEDPGVARDIYEKKLLFLYNPDTRTWKAPLSYYDDNWAWFGIALYNGLLPNLTKK